MKKEYQQGYKDLTEPELPTEIDLGATDFVFSEGLADDIADAINEYLAEKYGYCVNCYGWEIKITDIDWDITE